MSIKLFIAGTDTNIGKTYISVGLLHQFNQQGLSTIGIKPIASGATIQHGQLVNNDALLLQHAASIKLAYHHINPFTFEPAIAPHLAAALSRRCLTISQLTGLTSIAMSHPADICLIEGAGGWRVPLNDTETMADYAIQQTCKVILVVGIKLGCINHAILTYQSMQQDQANVIGWIANKVEPDTPYADEIIQTLQRWLHIPCLGVVHHGGPVHINVRQVLS
jgi:dethiobiotin synthetase